MLSFTSYYKPVAESKHFACGKPFHPANIPQNRDYCYSPPNRWDNQETEKARHSSNTVTKQTVKPGLGSRLTPSLSMTLCSISACGKKTAKGRREDKLIGNRKKGKKDQLSLGNNLESEITQKLQNSTSERRNTIILVWKRLQAHLLKRCFQAVKTKRPEAGQLWAMLLPGILPKIISLQSRAMGMTKAAHSTGRRLVGQLRVCPHGTFYLDLKTSAYVIWVFLLAKGINIPVIT